MKKENLELYASAAVAAVASSWGCWWIFLRMIEGRGISPGWTLALVYGGSAVLLAPLLVYRPKRWSRPTWQSVAVGVAYALPLGFWSHAVIHGDVVRVTLLFYLTPVWGTLAAVAFFGERMTPLRLFAVLLGVGGAFAVLGLEHGLPIPRSVQEWMSLAAGVLFAGAATASRRWPVSSSYDSSFFMFAGSGLLGILFATLFSAEAAPPIAVAVGAVPLVLALAVLFAIPSQLVLFWAASKIDPGRVTTMILFDVLATTISALIVTDDPFGWREVLGCVFIIGAGLVSGVDQMRQSRLGNPAGATVAG